MARRSRAILGRVILGRVILGRAILGRAILGGALLAASAVAQAADFPADDPVAIVSPGPRFFPRSDGGDLPPVFLPPRRRVGTCAPRWVPIPTNAPDDPSYVGSPYGLGKPSYYGFRPPLGYDDPAGRPLAYCP